MSELLKITLIGLFFGTFGTTIGGIIGIKLKNTSNKFLSFILEFAAGLMVSIVCFELIPEALALSDLLNILVWVGFGVVAMILCDNIINKTYRKKEAQTGKTSSLLKTGIIVGIGLAIHNFPEGLAIGSGFELSTTLGLSLALAIATHDIPEGISMSVPMKSGGMKPYKVLLYTAISGITTGIGAFFGGLLGTISENIIAACLAFAAGSMLYIASRRTNSRIK